MSLLIIGVYFMRNFVLTYLKYSKQWVDYTAVCGILFPRAVMQEMSVPHSYLCVHDFHNAEKKIQFQQVRKAICNRS